MEDLVAVSLSGMVPSASDLSATRQADIIGRLWLNRHSWVLRRHDRTTLVDPQRVQWETRFEFMLPGFNPNIVTPTIPVPLLYARKNPLITVEVRDGDGNTLPTLTWDERRLVLERLLIDTARKALTQALEPNVEELLKQLLADETESRDAFNRLVALGQSAVRPIDQLSPELRALFQAGHPATSVPWTDSQRQQAALLFDNDVLGLLMPEFRAANLLIGVLDYSPGARRVVEIRHDTLVGKVDLSHRGRVRRIEAFTLPVSSARSYHAVLQVPEGVVFAQPVRIGSIGLPLPEGTIRNPAPGVFTEHDLPVQCGLGPPKDGWRSTVNGRVLELHVVTGERRAAVAVMARAGLRSEGGGAAQVASPLVTVTMLVMLGGVALRSAGVTPTGPGSSTGLLVALLSAFAGYFLQRPSSPTERLVARGPRAVIGCALGLSAAAAVTLTLDFPASRLPGFATAMGWGWRAITWLGLAAASICLWLFTAWARRRW